MKQTITPERLLGEYIGTLKGICAWDIPEQLKEKLERRIGELENTEIDIADIQLSKVHEAIAKLKAQRKAEQDVEQLRTGEGIYDITTMD